MLARCQESRQDGAVSRRLAPLLISIVSSGPALGCGASFESLYESEVRFEHCYRLDLEEHAAPTHRLFCWQEWLETYSLDQSRDRIEYSRRRVHALSSGDVSRPTLQVGSGSGRSAAQGALPDNASVAPPSVVRADTPAPREPSCADACLTAFSLCRQSCEGACDGCAADYQACSQRCLDKPAAPPPSAAPAGSAPAAGAPPAVEPAKAAPK